MWWGCGRVAQTGAVWHKNIPVKLVLYFSLCGIIDALSPGVPDISSCNKNRFLALLAGDAIHWELGNVVTTVGVDLWKLKDQKHKGQFSNNSKFVDAGLIVTLREYLHLQLSDVIYRPCLIIVVVIGNRGEAAGTLVRCDATIRKILYRSRAADPCFWDSHRHAWRLKVLTFQNFYVD